MSKNWGFGGFWVSWWVFCHCNPTYDTFLESLGPWGCSESVSRIFGHHQDDQEGQECPKKCQFWIQKLTKNQSLFYLKTDTILIIMDYISCCPNKYVWQKPKKIYLVLFGVERPKKWKKSILFQKTGHNRKYVFSAHKILLATTWPWIFIIKIDWDKWVAWKNLVSSCW